MTCRYVSLPQFSRYQFARATLYRHNNTTYMLSDPGYVNLWKTKNFSFSSLPHTRTHIHTSFRYLELIFFYVFILFLLELNWSERVFESVCCQPVRDNFVSSSSSSSSSSSTLSSSLSMLSVPFYEQFFSFASCMILHLKFISTTEQTQTHSHKRINIV